MLDLRVKGCEKDSIETRREAMIRLPKRFMDDHSERDLPTPEVVRETKTHYYVDPLDPNLPELLDDAKYYAEDVDCVPAGIVASARATVAALN